MFLPLSAWINCYIVSKIFTNSWPLVSTFKKKNLGPQNSWQVRPILKTKYQLLLSFCHQISWHVKLPILPQNEQQIFNFDSVLFQVIKTPMDLGTMKVKIENKGYTSHLDFATDMRLVFTNCYKYNPPDHEIGSAHHMFSRFLNLRILFTKFSLFCFPTRQKFSIEIKNVDANFDDFRKKDTLQPSTTHC